MTYSAAANSLQLFGEAFNLQVSNQQNNLNVQTVTSADVSPSDIQLKNSQLKNIQLKNIQLKNIQLNVPPPEVA